MKRFLVFGLAAGLCLVASGCGPDTHDTLIQRTTGLMDKAAAQVAAIKEEVSKATESARKGNLFKLDEAVKAAQALKETGKEAQALKKKISEIRGSITDDDKKANLEKNRGTINSKFRELMSRREELRVAMEDATKYFLERKDNEAKLAIEDLRKKLVEAEAPFEQLAN
ncbi:MAG: hypothetical protein FJ303_18660 [Planctomycetes bacterium]|nr:hypothetical protein [Planctomycetota bacterium]